MQHYKLDPAHNFSAPGLAWDAMLKMTGVELSLDHQFEIKVIIICIVVNTSTEIH